MKKLLSSVLTAALLASVSLAQNSAQPNGQSESQNTAVRIAPDAILRIELAKSVDAKKAKVGDAVTGKTMDDFQSGKNDVLVPKGSRVLAHIAEVSPLGGESASTLGIAFDKIVLKNGTDVPLKASIQAIGRPEPGTAPVNQPMAESGGGAARPMSAPGRDSYGDGYGGSMQGQGGTPASVSPTSAANPGADSATAQLAPNTQGVVGMSGVSLSTGSADDSLLSSQKHTVKLDSGTQMILRVAQ